jgi:hypothetical protein
MSDFLTRWSRRKRAAEAEVARAATPDAGRTDAKLEHPGAPHPERLPLPDIGDIGADTDIKGFLASEVAPELRKAALRRAWVTDPTIREFVGPARDYAYDWNTPGGVPGFGPLAPAAAARAVASVGEMLTRLGTTARIAPKPSPPPADEHPTSEEPTT